MAKNVKPIPDGYHTVTPYLVIPGVAKLIEFLKTAFQATELNRHLRPDGAVMHAEVQIGDSKIMLGEASDQNQARPTTLHLFSEDVDSVYRRAIQAGGTSLREPADQFYGDRMAGVQDPAGNQWWIAMHIEDVSPQEMERRMAAAQR